MAVQADYVWINEVGKHFLGAPFGGVKQSGFGREESLDEMLRFTQEKISTSSSRRGFSDRRAPNAAKRYDKPMLYRQNRAKQSIFKMSYTEEQIQHP